MGADDGLLTIPEAADLLRLKSRDAVYALIASGDLDTVDIAPTGSRRPKTRVPAQSLHALIKRRTRNAKELRTA